MAWIYSQESADSQSHSNPGSAPLHTVSETPTLRLCCCHEWLLTNSTVLRSGTTLHRSEAPCFQESTSSLEDSPVRTSALQDVASAWLASEAGFTLISKDLSAKQTQLSSFLKTSLQSGHADLVVWCEDWPRSGMISGGQLYLPRALERITSANAGSSWLPTPTASSFGSSGNGVRKGKQKQILSLETMARKALWPTPRTTGLDGGSHSRDAAKRRGMWPTPRANDAEKRGAINPNDKRNGLSGAVRLFPTPRASDGSKGQRSPEAAARYAAGPNGKNGVDLPTAIGGGQLNPKWIEWLMGFPLGWTELDAWATQWYRFKRASLLKHSRDSKKKGKVNADNK